MSSKHVAFFMPVLLWMLPALVAAQEWEKLGAREVSLGFDHDAISCTGEGAFTTIRIEVQGGDVEMYNIKIVFGDAQTFSPETRIQFDEGSWSRSIDLPGVARSIRTVEFWYRSRHPEGHATVTLFGKRANAIEIEAGWEKLGSRIVDFSADKDTISCEGEGRFTAIRLYVENGDLVLSDLKVTFGDGTSYSPGTRMEFMEGSRSRSIELPGIARSIRKVDFWYRSEPGKTKATLVLYGRTAQKLSIMKER